MQKLIAVVGPTASGKTALSVSIAAKFGGEVVSADSMQIYREMNIGTAKPTPEERLEIPHHLIGFLPVSRNYNVASYVRDARRVLADLDKRGVLPVLCGGTGLYLDHLLQNTDFFEIPCDDSVRAFYQRTAREKGGEYLYRLLSERDPVLAESLHPNDEKRVIRGLEVLDITGTRLSDYQKASAREPVFDVLYLGLNYRDRSILYDRIDRRVERMMENGLAEEVRELLRAGNLSSTARAAIGYKELADCFENGGSIEEAVALIQQKTRNYAKRQITWFKRNEKIHWIFPDECGEEGVLKKAFELTESFLIGGTE